MGLPLGREKGWSWTEKKYIPWHVLEGVACLVFNSKMDFFRPVRAMGGSTLISTVTGSKVKGDSFARRVLRQRAPTVVPNTKPGRRRLLRRASIHGLCILEAVVIT